MAQDEVQSQEEAKPATPATAEPTPTEPDAIRGAYLVRRAQLTEVSSGGEGDAIALRGAYLRHLSVTVTGVVRGDPTDGGVLRSVYAARAADAPLARATPARKKAKAKPKVKAKAKAKAKPTRKPARRGKAKRR